MNHITLSAAVNHNYMRFAFCDSLGVPVWSGKFTSKDYKSVAYQTAFTSLLEKAVWLARKAAKDAGETDPVTLFLSVAMPTKGNDAEIPASIFRRCRANDIRLTIGFSGEEHVPPRLLKEDHAWQDYEPLKQQV